MNIPWDEIDLFQNLDKDNFVWLVAISDSP